MNWVVYHIVSGHAFFSGVGLVIFAAVASLRSKGAASRLSGTAFLVGLIAIVLSSTPLSIWVYAIAGGTSCLWIASRIRKQKQKPAAQLMAVTWAILALIEVPYHFPPTLRPEEIRSITVIGDSLTAGVDGDETSETWPTLLARQHQIHVDDVSHIGETAASALKRVQAGRITSKLVIVEIGGNDILGSTTPEKFAADLDALLKFLAEDDRQIVMFELPLPPFYNQYGRVQRQLASKHHVRLVPKATLLNVIAGSDSTLDSIHLTQSGHQLTTDCVWKLIKSALPAN